MVAYLSDEWMEQAAAALATSSELAERTADIDLAVAYEITGAPGGKVLYTVRFDHGTTALESGVSDAPVSFVLDYDSAAAIAQGDLSAQVAFMQGRLKLVGDVNVLIRDGALLDGVADALGTLRSDTQF